MAGSVFRKVNVLRADNTKEDREVEVRRREILKAAGEMIGQLRERGMVPVRGQVNEWLRIAENQKEHATVRVCAMHTIDSVMGNLASAIYYNKQDSKIGQHGDAFSRSVAARAVQLVDSAPLALPLLNRLAAIAEETNESQVRSVAEHVRFSVEHALNMIEGHRSNNVVNAFPALKK